MKKFLTLFSCVAVLVSTALAFPYFTTVYSAQGFSELFAEGKTRPGTSPLVSTTLVINEIDYDQLGTDTAEFVELKNVSANPINLDNYTLELVNGSTGGAAIYDTINLPNVNLAAGGYYVICANTATVVNCDLDDAPDTDFIQNGAPDAVGLRESGVLIDTVSYEGNTGAPYTEMTGVPVAAADSNTIAFIGLSRFPDGADTDNNSADLSLRCISPGSANLSTTTGCTAPVVVTAAGGSVGGRVMSADGRAVGNAMLSLTDQSGVTQNTRSNPFGYYRFDNVLAGQTYVVSVKSKRFVFAPQVVGVNEELTNLDFIAEP